MGRFFIALGLAAVLLLAGCAKPEPSSSATPTKTLTPTASTLPTTGPTTRAVTGPYGELRVGATSFGAEVWDPVFAPETNVTTLLAVLYDYMFRNSGSDLAPGVVSKWEMTPDGSAWLFTLTKGIKWHDGAPMTIEDLQFAMQRYSTPEAFYGSVRELTTGVVDIVDDDTIRIYTNGVQPYLPMYLSTGVGSQGLAVPKDYFLKNGADYFQKHPIGNGPWKFVRHVPGDMVEFEAVPNHYRQVPAFKKLSLILVPEETTRLAMIKTGALDLIDLEIEGGIDAEAAGLRTAPLGLNSDNIIFLGVYMPEAAKLPAANVRIRQALSLAVNRDEIVRTIFYGKSTQAAPGMNTYNSPDIDVAYWKDYCAKAWRYDPEEAKKIIKEEGYPNGFDIKIYSFTMGGASYLPELCQVVQGYWMKVGVNATIVPTDWGTMTSMRTSAKPGRNPQPALVGAAAIIGSSEVPIALRKLNSGFTSKGTWNLFNGTNAEMDKVYNEGLSELNDEKRKALVARGLKMAVDSYVMLGLEVTPALAALGPKVEVEFPALTRSISEYLDLVKHR